MRFWTFEVVLDGVVYARPKASTRGSAEEQQKYWRARGYVVTPIKQAY